VSPPGFMGTAHRTPLPLAPEPAPEVSSPTTSGTFPPVRIPDGITVISPQDFAYETVSMRPDLALAAVQAMSGAIRPAVRAAFARRHCRMH
jgi:hypothetical protein